MALLLLPAVARAESGAGHLEQIRRVRLDPAQCYRVRDLFLEREDVKFYFTDGHLLLAEPVGERTVAALFVASSPADQGEILLIPPTAGERQSVARFTSEPVLNEKFRTALMFFTDDTAQKLLLGIQKSAASRLQPEAGQRLAEEWSPVMQNVLGGMALRILVDTLSDMPLESGFFAAAVGGSRLGRFDVVVDPRLPQQVGIGQIVWHDNRAFFESWCSFRGINFRQGRRQPVEIPGRLENYQIEARLAADLSMQVVAKATFVPGTTLQRAFGFELSERLFVTKVLLDGQPAEFLQLELPASSEARRRQNNVVTLVLPKKPAPGARFQAEFHYDGKVIADAGDGVFYVGSRGNWYPRGQLTFTHFDLLFHHPPDLDLVATGELLESTTAAGVRSSRFRTVAPIRMAAFNLGRYARTSRKVGDYTLETCASLGLEKGLQPLPSVLVVEPLFGPKRPSPRQPQTMVVKPEFPEPPRPVERLEEVADKSAAAFSYFLEHFGPPATRRVFITPIPGYAGQGFPGLVYAPTLTYFRPEDEPLRGYTPSQRLFYADQLQAHEVAHQWWGNVVTVDASEDVWLMEGLATYSSLLFVEHTRGREALNSVLAEYKQQLLERNEDGQTVESAGAIVLGDRLQSSQFPWAARVILYQKGAWIMHMLRGLLGDDKFFAFLRELRDRFEFRAVSVEQFREAAARFLPPGWPDQGLRNFFDQWVYSTGIPTLRVTYRAEGKAPRVRFAGSLLQQNVPEHFSLLVPVRIHTTPGRSLVKQIRTDGSVTEFGLVLQNPPSRVEVDPEQLLLAVKEPSS